MLSAVDSAEYPIEYYRLRDKALICIFRLTGKRRKEVASLEGSDLAVTGENLSITFTVVKKRKKNIMSTRREKQIPFSDPLTKPIIDYWNWMKNNYPKCKYLFPRTFLSQLPETSGTLIVKKDQHLTGRQVLRIIKKINPKAWCHLFRETVGAEIIKRDPSILAPFRVMMRLDLESHQTAFNYMRRFATDIIEREL